ncbi:2Fe-2S iron-sulfur cluster-binding protein [Paenibacillus daejeonensis]|uniref:2Fe-2S iron-sulfur cluster-binding protein n=1 Tax=Paenibacillus daejeonensis TaxID=135193 RepID=UPI000367A3C3|nr:2Fe-2S iron-sulfur cluster-binding protein [Paenibacillus daejeonensis]
MMTEQTMVTCEVARKAAPDSELTYSTYTIPYRPGMTVLDMMRYIADELDGSFVYHDHSCKRGFCGSCMVKVDGKSKLSCRTLLDPSGIRLEPALKTARDYWPAEA